MIHFGSEATQVNQSLECLGLMKVANEHGGMQRMRYISHAIHGQQLLPRNVNGQRLCGAACSYMQRKRYTQSQQNTFSINLP